MRPRVNDSADELALFKRVLRELHTCASHGIIAHERVRKTIRSCVEEDGVTGQLESSGLVAKIFRQLKESGRLTPCDAGAYELKGAVKTRSRPKRLEPVDREPTVLEATPVPDEPTTFSTELGPKNAEPPVPRTPEERRGELIVLKTLRPPPNEIRLRPEAKPLRFLADMVVLEDRFGGQLPHDLARWFAIDYMRRIAPATNEGHEYQILRKVGFMKPIRRLGQKRDDWFVTPEGRACVDRLGIEGTLTSEEADAYIERRGYALPVELPNLLARLSQVRPELKQARRDWQETDLNDPRWEEVSDRHDRLESEYERLMTRIGYTRLKAA